MAWDMDRRIMYLCAGLGILCAFLAGFDVILWNTNRSQDSRLKVAEARDTQVESAQMAERRATALAHYSQCIGAIRTIHIANTVILSQKSILADLASAARDRAAIETGERQALDQALVVARTKAASELVPFPRITKAQCVKLRNRELPPKAPTKEEGGP